MTTSISSTFDSLPFMKHRFQLWTVQYDDEIMEYFSIERRTFILWRHTMGDYGDVDLKHIESCERHIARGEGSVVTFHQIPSDKVSKMCPCLVDVAIWTKIAPDMRDTKTRFMLKYAYLDLVIMMKAKKKEEEKRKGRQF